MKYNKNESMDGYELSGDRLYRLTKTKCNIIECNKTKGLL